MRCIGAVALLVCPSLLFGQESPREATTDSRQQEGAQRTEAARVDDPQESPTQDRAEQESTIRVGKAGDVKPLSDFGTAVSPHFFVMDSKVENADLANFAILGSARSVRHLVLDGGGVSDEGLRHLSLLRGLNRLAMSRVPVAGTGLKPFADLPEFHSLKMRACPISLDGIKCIGELRSLETLGLRDTFVDDHGIRYLTTLQRLKTLDLGGTRVTDKGVGSLRNMQSIEELVLNDCVVGDDAIDVILTLENLTELQIANTHISPDGLLRIAELTNLKYLLTSCTAERGIKGLRQAAPTLFIVLVDQESNYYKIDDNGDRQKDNDLRGLF